MNSTIKTSILNYDTVDLLREKIHYGKATVRDFETIEELLEAFGRPRDLVLQLLRPHTIYSYNEFIPELVKFSRPGMGNVAGTILYYLDRMAEYFIEKENLQPEPWVLKNPNSIQ